MKLKTKFILPLSVTLLIVVFCSSFLSRHLVDKLVDQQLSSVEKNVMEDLYRSSETLVNSIKKQTERYGQFGSGQAALFAKLPFVLDAYKKLAEDEEAAMSQMSSALMSIFSSQLSSTGIEEAIVNFFLPDGSLFFSSDLVTNSLDSAFDSDFAKQLVDKGFNVNQSLRKFGDKIVISAYYPIYSEDNQLEGFVEFQMPFKMALETISQHESDLYVAFTKIGSSFTKTDLSAAQSPVEIDAQFVNKSFGSISTKRVDNYYLLGFPILNKIDQSKIVIVHIAGLEDQLHRIRSAHQFGEETKDVLLWAGGFSVLGTIFFVFFMVQFLLSRFVIKPLNTCVEHAQHVSNGDFTVQLESKHSDEIGQLIEAFNKIAASFNDVFTKISSNIIRLSSTSNELSTISQQVLKNSEGTSDNTQSVASASEEMSSNMNTVAAASEQASTNIFSLSNSVSELNNTFAKIAEKTKQASSVTDNSVALVTGSSNKVDSLGSAVKEIGQVTEEISAISEKTDLLALNATIEAARAGEAGKGFAVVANEVKSLANRTATSTMAIQKIIREIQQSTDVAVSEIKQITEIIAEVNEIVADIAEAVETQALTTGEIAENVSQAAQGIDEVAKNVGQSSSAASEIAKEITHVSQATNNFTESSSHINQSAQNLAEIASNLKQMLASFKTSESELAGESEDSDEAGDDQILIEWSDSLMVNIPQIDTQHQKLVVLINQLHNAMKVGKSRAIVGETLKGLIEYTAMHFKTEEDLMETYQYPQFSEHKAAHEKLVESVLAFQQQFQNNEAFVAMDVMEFLKDWLINHINGTDKAYSPFLREHLDI